jgi:hypothetical protein
MLDNLLNPMILCFVVGLSAGLLKSDLRLPNQMYETLSLFLLFSIGLKGGVEMARSDLLQAMWPIMATLGLGIIIPIIAFFILRGLGRLNQIDSANIAAHYGSVSAVTFAIVTAFLLQHQVPYESFVTLLLVILEIPAIAVGILIARIQLHKLDTHQFGEATKPLEWKALLHEVFFGKSIFLLLGGVFVGYFSGPVHIQSIAPVFFDLFKGALAVFLLEMGVITSRRFSDLKSVGPFLVVFGMGMPVISGAMGAFLGTLSGLSIGGATVLATLAGSASYIAAPAAMRMALPKANPTLSLTASLAITFPFNLVAGIPLYFWMSQSVHAWIGG